MVSEDAAEVLGYLKASPSRNREPFSLLATWYVVLVLDDFRLKAHHARYARMGALRGEVMWPFRRKSKSTERISRAPNELNLPGDEMTQIFRKTVRDLGEDEALELVFERCDFKLARDEIADFFQVVNAEGRREGKVAYYKQEFVRGWQVFSANPSADTARAWLKAAPDYKDMIQSYLVECCPGGKFAFYSRLLKH